MLLSLLLLLPMLLTFYRRTQGSTDSAGEPRWVRPSSVVPEPTLLSGPLSAHEFLTHWIYQQALLNTGFTGLEGRMWPAYSSWESKGPIICETNSFPGDSIIRPSERTTILLRPKAETPGTTPMKTWLLWQPPSKRGNHWCLWQAAPCSRATGKWGPTEHGSLAKGSQARKPVD